MSSGEETSPVMENTVEVFKDGGEERRQSFNLPTMTESRGAVAESGGPGGTHPDRDTQARLPDEDEPRAKIPKREEAAQEVLPDGPDLLTTQPNEMIVEIARHLDRKSLRNLGFTCKKLYELCLKTKIIDIVFPINTVKMMPYEYDDDDNSFSFKHDLYGCKNKGWLVDCLKTLQKRPFTVHISTFELFELISCELTITVIKEFFLKYGVKKIGQVVTHVPPTVPSLEHFINEIVKVFRVERVFFEGDMEQDIHDVCLTMPVKDLVVSGNTTGRPWFEYGVTCSIPTIDLSGDITLAGLEVVMEMWKTMAGLESWILNFEFCMQEFVHHFYAYYEVRHFEDLRPFALDYPPVFFQIVGDPDSLLFTFYVLRSDRKVFYVSLDPYSDVTLSFLMLPPTEWRPTALQGI